MQLFYYFILRGNLGSPMKIIEFLVAIIGAIVIKDDESTLNNEFDITTSPFQIVSTLLYKLIHR